MKVPLKDAAQRLMTSDTARRVIPLVFSLAFGLVGVVLARNWYQAQARTFERQKQELLANYKPPVPVVAAAKDLPPDTTIDAGHLTTIGVPPPFIQPYAARSPNEVVGLVTTAAIAEGEQLLTNKLRRADAAPTAPRDATLSALTPKGKRAVTIAVDAITGVGGFVRPGDKVDILWTLKLPGDQAATLTLFQEVPVLAVGGEMAGRPAPRDSQAASGTSQFTITLAMTPQDTSSLLFAREQGRIQLSLRPKLESGLVAIPPANIQTLLEAQFGIKASEPPPQVTRQVEIYKGLKRDVMVLAEEEDVAR